MEFLRTLVGVLVYEPGTVAAPLFLCSVLALVTGIALRVRSKMLRLSDLLHIPLSSIERNHPHLPSPSIILVIAACCFTLLLAGLKTLQGSFPFNDPYDGLYLASLFLFLATIGILAELEWKGARRYTSGVLSGTALAFLFVILRYGVGGESALQKAALIVLLLPSLAFVAHQLPKGGRMSSAVTAAVAFAFWLALYFLQ